MDLGIICAMPMEAKGLTRLATPIGQAIRINEHCLLVCSGIGPLNASKAATTLHRQGVGAILSWGCAAGLQPHLHPGTLVLPDAVLTQEGEQISVDCHLQQQLKAALSPSTSSLNVHMLSVDVPISTRQQKAELYQQHGAIALDMESSAIGQTAKHCQLPFAIIRVILDPAEQTLPSMAVAGLQSDGSFNLRQGLAALIKHPGDLYRIARLANNAHRANKVLRSAATQLTSQALTDL